MAAALYWPASSDLWDTLNHCLRQKRPPGIMPPPLAAAASGASSLMATLRFNPVPDEDMLPEVRKEIADEMWEIIVTHGIDCIFEDRLPPAEEYAYTEVNLDSAPLLDPKATNADKSLKYTQAEVDKAANRRKEIENQNNQRRAMHDRLLKDYVELGLSPAQADEHAVDLPLLLEELLRRGSPVIGVADLRVQHGDERLVGLAQRRHAVVVLPLPQLYCETPLLRLVAQVEAARCLEGLRELVAEDAQLGQLVDDVVALVHRLDLSTPLAVRPVANHFAPIGCAWKRNLVAQPIGAEGASCASVPPSTPLDAQNYTFYARNHPRL